MFPSFRTRAAFLVLTSFTPCGSPSKLLAQQTSESPLGIFGSHEDIGETPKKGSVEYKPSTGEYTVTGGGSNIWATADAFQFLLRKVSGDVTLSADVKFIGAGAVAHRKVVLMVRQDLTPGSAYGDASLHGDGLASLQFRPVSGAATQELQSAATGPIHLRLERRGNQFTIFVNKAGEEPVKSGPIVVALQDPVYAGIGVCSHDATVLESAVFSNVKIETAPASKPPRPQYRSKISVYDLATKATRVVYASEDLWEAPNWAPDGKYLLANMGGGLYRIALDQPAATPQRVEAGQELRCNNDHGFSPDGKGIAFSASTATSHGSLVFKASLDGSGRKQMTTVVPSYFHGWSPDGAWLAIVAQREGHFNLFRVPAQGGDEQRLTSKPVYDDGPDYSPDGRWIYFNSDRSGSWDVWRMPADGAGPNDAKAEQVTKDDLEDWFPHPSPDGKSLVFLSFPKGTTGHDDKLSVQLRMMPLPGDVAGLPKIQNLRTFFGGQGTINVNSWSPDSTKFAFVAYEPK